MMHEKRNLGVDSDKLLASDPRSSAILDLLTRLVAGSLDVRASGAGQGDTLDRIIDLLNQLADNLRTQHTTQAENEQRFEEFLEVISGMAALDFSRKAWVGEAGSIIDAMAYGINMLSEELALSTVSRAYVDNIIESLLDALVVVEQGGTIRTVNRAAVRLLGYEREELIGQPIAMLFAQAEATEQVLDALAHEKSVNSEELTWRTSAGHVFPVSFSASAMYHANGSLQGIVCIIRDISERKQAEESLRRSIAQEETIRIQAAMLAELSTPLIPISDRVMVMPLIGAVDSRRAQQVLETLIEGIARTNAQVVILDITGVPVVDTHVANAFMQAAQAVKLIGAQMMLTGIRPEVAQTLVDLGIDLRTITTHSTLQSGIAAVLKRM